MLVEFSKGGFLAKAESQPDKVKQVLDKIKTDGLLPTMETVFKRLDELLPLGYSNVGIIKKADRGRRNAELREGDRVVSSGPHAEYVCVPENLCAKVPDGMTASGVRVTPVEHLIGDRGSTPVPSAKITADKSAGATGPRGDGIFATLRQAGQGGRKDGGQTKE